MAAGFWLGLLVGASFTGTGCHTTPRTVAEEFREAERPHFVYPTADNYYSCLPWNYNKASNAKRAYPLVVFLHGGGGAGNLNYLSYLGYDDPHDHSVDPQARAFQIRHPSFVLVPQTPGSWDYAQIIQRIEEFKSRYRIDPRRIYLIGYSMGGSGSYALANAYYDYNGGLFAGIIRLAGQSQTTVREAIAQRSSIWLHIGLRDNATRIQVTREAYGFLKAFHAQAKETTNAVGIAAHPGTTWTLTVDGVEVAKKTEYTDDAHGIVAFPFQDDSLIEWLYRQVLR